MKSCAEQSDLAANFPPGRRTVLACGNDGEAAGNPGPSCINGCGMTLDMGHCKSVCPTCGIWQTCHD